MGKSYKKTPINKDGHKSGKYGKKRANRKVRSMGIDYRGKSMKYKRCFEPWDIFDDVIYWSLKDALENWEKYYSSKEECINHWKKNMIRK